MWLWVFGGHFDWKICNSAIHMTGECAECVRVCVCESVRVSACFRVHTSTCLFTFGRVSMVAGAISVSSMSCFSMALFFVGVELFLFFRDGDGVPASMHARNKKKKNRTTNKQQLSTSAISSQGRNTLLLFFSRIIFNSTISNMKLKFTNTFSFTSTTKFKVTIKSN